MTNEDYLVLDINDLLRKMYFDPSVPENHMWYISNYKEKFGGMEYNPKTKRLERCISNELVIKHLKVVETHLINYLANIEQPNDNERNKINIVLEAINYELGKRTIDAGLLTGYNNNEVVKDTHNESVLQK